MYYIIENATPEGPDVCPDPYKVHGPFKTIDDAKAFIMQDAEDTFCPRDEGYPTHTDIYNWGSRMIIVKYHSTWKPIPRIEVLMGIAKQEANHNG